MWVENALCLRSSSHAKENPDLFCLVQNQLKVAVRLQSSGLFQKKKGFSQFYWLPPVVFAFCETYPTQNVAEFES